MRRRFSKDYLGDGVYVVVDEAGAVVLTTEDGIQTTNRIVLEPETLHAFELWLGRARREARAEQSTEELRAEEPK